MTSPIRRCSLKGKAIATASDSDNGSSPRLLVPRAITLRRMILRPTSADFAVLNENERNIVQFSLDLEDRDASGQAAVDDMAEERPWTPPAGYACVYESWFTNCSLWWPLPEFLTTYCHRRRIALGQYTANGIRILVTLTVLAAELGISMSVCLFEELTTPSITTKTGFFYGKMVPKYNIITEKPSKVNFWNRAYFYWSQGGTGSFLEEVEDIRTLSHQHWPDISEARIQAALKRISRAINSSPSRNPRMRKVNLASLPFYADTIGTPVHGGGSPDTGRPVKRRRPTSTEEEIGRSGPTRSPLIEGPTENANDLDRQQELPREEVPLLSPAVSMGATIADEMPLGEQSVIPQVTAYDEQAIEADTTN
ncbi:hypothetical protein N665_0383s0059 [Sinapis alba]|nr:hypothetical protein N665_0383s0059 [Sinapis alba]